MAKVPGREAEGMTEELMQASELDATAANSGWIKPFAFGALGCILGALAGIVLGLLVGIGIAMIVGVI